MNTISASVRAKKIIENNFFLTLGTASRSGEPWVSPVYFAFDKKGTFYWYSPKDAWHSKLIKENPTIAITVFNGGSLAEADGVYFRARASAVTVKELPWAMLIYAKRYARHLGKARISLGKMAHFLGRSPLRMYKAVPQKAWVLGPERMFKGKFVDFRQPVQLGALVGR